MAAAWDLCGNPSSVHAEGRRARKLIEDARASVARAVGAVPRNIVFTSGGTEANALALTPGLRRAAGLPAERLVISAIEHASVLAGGRFPAETVGTTRVTGAGLIGLNRLRATLDGGPPALVSVMLANNETGAVQPIAEVAEIVHPCVPVRRGEVEDRDPGALDHGATWHIGRLVRNLRPSPLRHEGDAGVGNRTRWERPDARYGDLVGGASRRFSPDRPCGRLRAMRVDVRCKKCGQRRRLELGDPGDTPVDEFIHRVKERLAHQPSFECFGGHLELAPPLPRFWEIDWTSCGP